jgi:CBS-domain-containing membrane protein
MPVVDDDGVLIGILSQRDLFRSALAKVLGYGRHGQDRILKTILVKELMSTKVVTTTADTPLADAAKLMLERKLGCLVVVEGSCPIGILTESDFMRLATA